MKLEHVEVKSSLGHCTGVKILDPVDIEYFHDYDRVTFIWGRGSEYSRSNYSPYRKFCSYQVIVSEYSELIVFKVFCDIPDDIATMATLELGREFFWMQSKYHFEKVSNHARL